MRVGLCEPKARLMSRDEEVSVDESEKLRRAMS